MTATETLRIDAADLVATSPAHLTLTELDAALAERGVWLALDPPGAADLTLGAALGSGAPGPLAALFGPPRDQVIGLTFTAGPGTTVRSGGRVVKNVAGFDLAKLVIGGQRAFGEISAAHLRLRARPESDRTVAWTGTRAALAAATAQLQLGGARLAACEVLSPTLAAACGAAPLWTLLARAIGTTEGVAEELAAAAESLTGCSSVAAPEDVWRRWRVAVGGWQVAARIGVDPAAWAEAVALAESRGALGHSATTPRGTLRVQFGDDDRLRVLRALRGLREECAKRGWPLTVERADAATLAAVGIWGALPPGAQRLAERLRSTLGPPGAGHLPLWDADHRPATAR